LEALSGEPIIINDPAQFFELKYKAMLQLLDLEEWSSEG
jgi:hypothetical protein